MTSRHNGGSLPADDVLVLCYHAVSPTWTADLSARPEQLESQLSSLVRRGYHGVTFTEAVTGPPGGRRVAVTFDDAYRSVLDLGLPILRRLGLPATLFVPTDWVGREEPMTWPGIDGWLGGPHEHELMPLGEDGLRELAAAGWEIGSHTRSHPHLTQLGDGALEAELTQSRTQVEELMGAPCTSIAYPYGDTDARVAAATRKAGYAAAGTLDPRVEVADPMLWPRVGVWNADSGLRFKAKVAPLARRGTLEPVRRVVRSVFRGRG